MMAARSLTPKSEVAARPLSNYRTILKAMLFSGYKQY